MRNVGSILGTVGALVVLAAVTMAVTQDLRSLSLRDNQALDAEINAIIAQRQIVRSAAASSTTGVGERTKPPGQAVQAMAKPDSSARDVKKRIGRAPTGRRPVPPVFASLPVISLFAARH